MRAYVETHGCTLNQADSVIIKGILKHEGVQLVKNPLEADWIFLNTCAVKNATENRMLSRIRELSKMPGKLVVCGCLPRINYKAIQKLGKFLVLDTNSLDKIPRIIHGDERDFFSPQHLNKLQMPFVEQGLIAAIPIAEGCLGYCSFCATRHARGKLTSYPIKDIHLAVERAIGNGALEVRITAEDTGVYGWDIDTNLVELMRELSKIPGDFKIRIGMMDPFAAWKMLPDVVEAFEDPKFYGFVHLPVQSGSNKVLRDMKRKYTVKQFKEVVEEFRSEIQDVTIATDIIVGFPTETERDFEKTLSMLREVRPEITNVSMFYPRPRTPAARMKQLPTQVVKNRSRKCSKLCREISLEANQKLIGKVFKVSVLEHGKKGGFIARLPNYKQVILEDAHLGERLKVKITRAYSKFLKATKI